MSELPIVDFVRLDNDGPVADSVVEARLGAIKVGEPLDVDAVERAMNTVYGLDYYQNVRYGLVNDIEGTGVELELDARSWGPNYLQLGMEYSSAADSDSLFGLAASYLGTAINPLGGEWRATVVIGDEPAFVTDLYQPFGPKGLYFYAPSLNLESTQFNVYEGDERITEAQLREATLEFAIGRELPDVGRVPFRPACRQGRVRPARRRPDSNLRGGVSARRVLRPLLRRHDGQRRVSARRVAAFARMARVARKAFSRPTPTSISCCSRRRTRRRGGATRVLTTLRWDATVSGTAADSRLFRMGGFFDISGLNRNQLSGQHATRIGAAYYRRIGDLALFPAFAGASLELGNAWESRDDISSRDAILGGSFWAGVDTPIGPVYLGYGRAEGSEDAFYISLGRVF